VLACYIKGCLLSYFGSYHLSLVKTQKRNKKILRVIKITFILKGKMNCLVVAQSRLCMATIVFYTCILIPFLQLKKALLSIFKPQPVVKSFNEGYLPVTRFEDYLQSYNKRGNENVEEMCSICLVEFDREDVVSQLSRCGHAFHMHCIESWLDRNNFTCPLCRSFLFSSVNTCHGNCTATTATATHFTSTSFQMR
jgi:RING-H2 zinc finger protein RHA1